MAAQSTLRHSAAEAAIAAFLDKYTEMISTRLRKTSRTTRLLGTLALVASIVLAGAGGRRWWRRRRQERETGRKLVRTNSWLSNKDGSRTIYVPYKDGTSKVVIQRTKPLTFEAHRRLFLNPPRVSGLADGSVPAAQTKPGLNLAFLHQFLSLMSIMIPRWSSKEAGLLVSHGMFLMLRTYLSLIVARLDGEIVRDLVAGNGKQFLWGIVKVRYFIPRNPYASCSAPNVILTAHARHIVVRTGRFCIIHQCHDKIPRVKGLHCIPDEVDSVYP